MSAPPVEQARRELHEARVEAGRLIAEASARYRAAIRAEHHRLGGSIRATARHLGMGEARVRDALRGSPDG